MRTPWVVSAAAAFSMVVFTGSAAQAGGHPAAAAGFGAAETMGSDAGVRLSTGDTPPARCAPTVSAGRREIQLARPQPL